MRLRPQWLTTYDEVGHPHVLRLDEYNAGLHRRNTDNPSSCVCDPRCSDGVFVHRQMSQPRMYAPWVKGGH